ncbi:DUF2252 family protein [Dyella sp. ASV21]|uniref:DUF2252 family protein n=1 Tax=Dyella sp. ASV21 TaxID=2795114 RepID=UPI0018ED9160|nr:DUF2252 family protein [Dyella sp. ASV21]
MKKRFTTPTRRAEALDRLRNLKMARSSHRYVRGSTDKFYEWLDALEHGAMPEGPAIWICGDCHVGNLGPLANHAGQVEVQIRDLDQTVIGNPAIDLVRLSLSLASAFRGFDLPGVTTARMLEQVMAGYRHAFDPAFDITVDLAAPKPVLGAVRRSRNANWQTLAKERIEDTSPRIPLGKRFWPLSASERSEMKAMAQSEAVRALVTMLHSRESDAAVRLVDGAYWVKGCSSLGRLRYAALLEIAPCKGDAPDYCLLDIKQAVTAVAPVVTGRPMPRQAGQRVLAGARQLSPHLGKRMLAGRFQNKAVFIRELLPQDLKLELEQLNERKALQTAFYLAAVVGKAHSRQMDAATRAAWLADISATRSRRIDAPSWLWTHTVNLLAIHEKAYLEHCRRYALAL